MTLTLNPETAKRERTSPQHKARTKKQPPYNVILLDDDDHTYVYVIDMLRKLFGVTDEMAYQMAEEVDQDGRVVVDTTTLERAELKRDQIHAFGRDWRITQCAGSMQSLIEPVPV